MSDHSQRMYDYCLRFFVELKALGVSRAVISPGSRSTPLAITARLAGLELTVQHDERVAAFHALGQAKATGAPSVLICTSGTAGANYLPAVIEAHHTGVPMIICTADRPPELRRWGAGQTIDQAHLFGHNVRWFQELPVPSEVPAQQARALALRAAATAIEAAGPVHLNWPLREPLEPDAEPVAPEPTLGPMTERPPSAPSTLLGDLAAQHERGIIVVGPASLSAKSVTELLDFSRRWGWPLIADPASGLRVADSAVVSTAELLFGSDSFTSGLPAPEVVVRVGAAPTSKAYRLWLEGSPPARLVLVDPGVEWPDPTASVTHVVAGPVEGLFDLAPAPPRNSQWQSRWLAAEAAAAKAVERCLSSDNSELAAADSVVKGLGTTSGSATLMVSSSMPIRDLDIVMRPVSASIHVVANRGANGIDGIIATATGHAQATGSRTVVLMGDVAAVHDLGGLAAAARLGIGHLTIVVVDNNAGGIFSFLPVAGAIDNKAFETLFATPHGTDLQAVAVALGFATEVVDDPGLLSELVGAPYTAGIPRFVLFRTNVATTKHALATVRTAVNEALQRADC